MPLATLPGMFERTLTLSSAGKSYSFTGWKVGWATGPAELVRRRARGQAVADLHLRLAAAAGGRAAPSTRSRTSRAALAADLQARRDLLCAGLAEVGLDVRVPEGTYFATTDISALGWADGLAFCLALPERAGVVAIPTQGFYDDPTPAGTWSAGPSASSPT